MSMVDFYAKILYVVWGVSSIAGYFFVLKIRIVQAIVHDLDSGII